ncbi:unnamed protein product [Agarophyton chilense]
MKIAIVYIVLFITATLTVVRGGVFWNNSDQNRGLINGLNSLFSLHPVAKVLESTTSTIKFAAFGKVILYKNGKELREVSSTSPETVTLQLKRNDVVAFKAVKTGKKAGLMAVVTWGSTKYFTGEDRFTARGDYSTWEAGEKHAWNSAVTYTQKDTGATRTFCHWDRADNMDIRTGVFDDKASFIWRQKSNPGEMGIPAGTVYVRMVVGGENCGAPVKVNDEITFHRVPDPTENELSGQGDDDSSEGFCACKLTDERGGQCYDMEDTSAESGRCRPRPCDPKFECIISGTKICIRRRGGTKKVMAIPNYCVTVPAGDVETLIPYEG